jgi:small GTP-binding protein
MKILEDLGNLSYNKGKKCLIVSKKIIILGEGGIGKTTLLLRYTTGKFSEDTKMTVGSDFFTKKLKYEHGNCDVYLKLLLWDFAGEERFRFLLGDYTKGADIILVAFDLSRMKSLYHLVDWMEILESARIHKNNTPVFLIGNKYDLLSSALKIDYDYIKKWIHDYSVTKYFECSSRTGFNVEELFAEVTNTLINNSKKNYIYV